MTWPTAPMPAQAAAILLLPSGHRAFDEDFAVSIPVPEMIEVDRVAYHRFHLHFGGTVDDETRALYVLGGCYRPHGAHRDERHDPDEAHDQ